MSKLPRMLVTKEILFDAAHQLPNYNGKCERLHGHTWRMHVTLLAEVNPDDGIAYDFVMLKRVLKERVVDKFDHAYLNDHVEHPSAENLCLYVAHALEDLPLYEVKCWETPTSFATWRPDLPEPHDLPESPVNRG